MADLLELNEQENKKQIITMDFQNLKEMVNNMAKSILAFSQAKIDISYHFKTNLKKIYL